MPQDRPADVSMDLPVVAIVGRPNVGKSTLFNRILGKRASLVRDEPGVTRDRHYGRAEWSGWEFLLVDTGGFDPADESGVMAAVRRQVLAAIEEADVLLFLTDARQGPTPDDEEIVGLLRRTSKPVIWAVNKADGPELEAAATEFYALGADQVFPVAAASGRAVGDLLDGVVAGLARAGWTRDRSAARAEDTSRIRLAIVGRPNAGKSSLLNRLIGEERSVVHPEPGTTRDPVDVPLDTDEGRFLLVDTAGIRRRKYVKEALEHISALRALRVMERAHVVCLVCDASVGIGDLEARLAAQIWEAGRALLLVLNKWDLVAAREQQSKLQEQISFRLRHVPDVPLVRTSAKTGRGLSRILPAVTRLHERSGHRIATATLNRWLQAIAERQPPPTYHGRQVKLFYVTQPQVRPPTFVFFTNAPEGVPEAYRRFLANRLRGEFGLRGLPIRLLFRPRTPQE